MVAIYVVSATDGVVSAFTLAFGGAFLVVYAIWLTVYVPRNWATVRARMQDPKRGFLGQRGG